MKIKLNCNKLLAQFIRHYFMRSSPRTSVLMMVRWVYQREIIKCYPYISWTRRSIFLAIFPKARHCWRSRDELISDVLLWTSTYGRAKDGRPARTYIQQLCEDMGSNPKDTPEAMNDREKWRERVWDIRACGTTWWWWWWWTRRCVSIFVR